jgi:hypothetical protein
MPMMMMISYVMLVHKTFTSRMQFHMCDSLGLDAITMDSTASRDARHGVKTFCSLKKKGKSESLRGRDLRGKIRNIENYMDFYVRKFGKTVCTLLLCCVRLTLPV